MPRLIKMCRLCEDGGVMPLYRTPLVAADKDVVARVAKAMRVKGRPQERGCRTVVKDRASVLEVFEASGSVWWTKSSRKQSEPQRSIEFPGDKKAIQLANAHLKSVGLADRRAKPVSVAYTDCLIERSPDKEPLQVRAEQHVNYAFRVDGLPIWGPGAKMQVTFGEGGAVTEVLKFWREPSKSETKIQTISANAAARVFRRDDAFSDLSERTASVSVEEVTLGLYALPPRETQACLIPVYRFRGTVSTKHLDKYEFAKHVVAVKVTADLLKVAGGGITAATSVI